MDGNTQPDRHLVYASDFGQWIIPRDAWDTREAAIEERQRYGSWWRLTLKRLQNWLRGIDDPIMPNSENWNRYETAQRERQRLAFIAVKPFKPQTMAEYLKSENTDD